jgi:hypothetical protein
MANKQPDEIKARRSAGAQSCPMRGFSSLRFVAHIVMLVATEVWSRVWTQVGTDKDASLPLPVWLRILLLMALANAKEVAPRGSARGALRPELNLPVGLLAALLAELHERFFGLNAATMCSADQEPKATLQRPRAVEAKPLGRLRERRMAKFFDVRRLCVPFPLFLLSPMPSCRGWKPSLSCHCCRFLRGGRLGLNAPPTFDGRASTSVRSTELR